MARGVEEQKGAVGEEIEGALEGPEGDPGVGVAGEFADAGVLEDGAEEGGVGVCGVAGGGGRGGAGPEDEGAGGEFGGVADVVEVEVAVDDVVDRGGVDVSFGEELAGTLGDVGFGHGEFVADALRVGFEVLSREVRERSPRKAD